MRATEVVAQAGVVYVIASLLRRCSIIGDLLFRCTDDAYDALTHYLHFHPCRPHEAEIQKSCHMCHASLHLRQLFCALTRPPPLPCVEQLARGGLQRRACRHAFVVDEPGYGVAVLAVAACCGEYLRRLGEAPLAIDAPPFDGPASTASASACSFSSRCGSRSSGGITTSNGMTRSRRQTAGSSPDTLGRWLVTRNAVFPRVRSVF